MDNLEDTYGEWKASAEGALRTMSASGAVAYKVAVDVEELLKTDAELGFLLQLGDKELETLIASIRERLDRVGQ